MTAKLLLSDRTALATALLAQWDTASGPNTMEFYTGTQPASPATAITDQVLLGTVTCSDPLGTAADGALTFGAITSDSAADASGTATWARQRDGAGVARADWSVSNAAGDGVIKLNTTTIIAGGPIVISAMVVTMPGG